MLRTRRSDCLILGSGSSKAVSEKMPVVRELADALKQQIKNDPELKDLEDPKYQHLLNDPELLLTYLAQDQPWKKPWEAPQEWALFLRMYLEPFLKELSSKMTTYAPMLSRQWSTSCATRRPRAD